MVGKRENSNNMEGSSSSSPQQQPPVVGGSVGTKSTIDPVQWWRTHDEQLPCWYAATRKVLHLCTSSAAAERVFSLYSSTFGDQQNNALEDVRETSMMLQYNDRNESYGLVKAKLTLDAQIYEELV